MLQFKNELILGDHQKNRCENDGFESVAGCSLNERQEEIIEELRTIGKVDVETLAARRFAVTPQTVGRDLGELCDRGLGQPDHMAVHVDFVSTSSIGYEDEASVQ